MSSLCLVFLTIQACAANSQADDYETIISAEHIQSGPSLGSSRLKLSEESRAPLTLMPGLTPLQQGGQGGFASSLMWGSGSGSYLVLLDGVPVNDPTSPSGSFDFSLIDWSQIEEVTVRPHGGAVEFGPQALAGVLELKTRRLRSPTWTLGYGSFDHQRFSIAAPFRGMYDQHGQESLVGNAYFAAERSQSFSAARQEDGNPESDGYQRQSGFVNFRQDQGSQAFLEGGAWINQGKLQYDLGGGPGADDPDATTSHKYISYRLGLAVFGDSGSQTSLSWQGLTLQRSEDNQPHQGSSFEFQGLYAARENELKLDFHRQVTGAAKFKGGFGTKLKLQNFSESGSFGSANESYSGRETAAYVMPEFHLGENVDLFMGVRALCLQCESSNSFSGSAKEIGLQLSHNEWRPYIRYAEGLKAPTLFQLYSHLGDRNLATEKLQSYSLGFERVMLMAKVNAQVFENNYLEQIQFAAGRFQNLERSRIRGAGLLVQSQAGVHLKYDYVTTRDLTTDLALIRRPQHFVSLQKVLTFSQLEVVPALMWKSQVEDLDQSNQRVRLAAYDRFDLEARVKNLFFDSQNLLVFRAENLFGKDYQDALGYGAAKRDLFVSFSSEF